MLIRYKKNLIYQYTVIIFAVVLAVSIALGFTISRQVTDHLIRSHIGMFPFLVKHITRNQPQILDFFQSPAGNPLPAEVEQFLNDLAHFGTVFRVKVWAADATVLWSNNPEQIGQRFPENKNFQASIQGEVRAVVKNLAERENRGDQGYGKALSIYIPALIDGQTVGVVEIYESDRDLFIQIARNNRMVWLTVLFAGAILYLTLFGIFLNAHRRQKKASQQLIETQDVTILALAHQAEIHDLQTGYHLERTTLYLQILAEELARSSTYQLELSPAVIDEMVKAAPLHDIGKVGVSDAILRKPGKLTDEEFATMQRHCEDGAAILKRAEAKLSFHSFLSRAIELILYHHEKWNGQGYPHGLKQREIPLSARIMALADVYDALRSERYYKEAFAHQECRRIILEERGAHFDPAVVDAFLAREQDFVAVSEQYVD